MTTIKVKDNLIVDLSFNFGLASVEFTDELQIRRKFAVANQLLRSGTSIGASIWESQNAESKRDFIHKLKIAAKEGEETEYWLLLCKH
jgi:four helix bundle protein